jgi:hypothetical protein
MDDLSRLQRIHKRHYWINRVIQLAGMILFASNLGIRAWLLGLGLVLYATTWEGITGLALELIERLDALKTAKST